MNERPIRFTHLLIAVVSAALAFGGSFTCRTETNGDDDDDDDGSVVVTTKK